MALTKIEKRIRKMSQHPADVSSDELISLLQSLGFECREGKGSHMVCTHLNLPGHRLTVPKQQPLRSIYVKSALKLIYLLLEGQENE